MERRRTTLLALLVLLALVPTGARAAVTTVEYCAQGSPSGLLALRPTPDVNARALLTLAEGDCGVFVASNAARSKQFVRATVDGQRGWVVAAWIVRAPKKRYVEGKATTECRAVAHDRTVKDAVQCTTITPFGVSRDGRSYTDAKVGVTEMRVTIQGYTVPDKLYFSPAAGPCASFVVAVRQEDYFFEIAGCGVSDSPCESLLARDCRSAIPGEEYVV
jgi:hypothetical protein